MLEMESKTSTVADATIQNTKLHHALYHLRFQHLFLSCLFLLIILLYYNHPDVFLADALSIWATASSIFLILGFGLDYLFYLEPQISHTYKKFFIYLSALVSGIFCALSYFTLNITLLQTLGFDRLFILNILFICLVATHLSAVFLLTYNYKHFLLFMLPTIIPILQHKNHINEFSHASPIYLLLATIYFGFFLILGFLFTRSREHVFLKHASLIHLQSKYQSSNNHVAQLEQQLQHAAQREMMIKEEMELNQNIMEEKVKERTADIKEINARLARSHQNLEMAHETAGIASWDWDIENRCIETGNFIRLFGYNIQNVGYYIKNLEQFIHPDDLENVKYNMRSHLRGVTERYEVTYRLFHQTEGWIWVHDLGRVIQRNPKNKIPLRMVGIRRNINDEKKVEERLTLSANVFQKMPQGIFILDSQLRYVDANPYFLSMVGLTEKELFGSYIFEISKNYTAELQQLHLGVLKQLMMHGEFEGEVLETLQTGKDTPMWVHVNSICDSQQRISQYIGIVTDLTERKAAEKKLSYLQTYDALTDLPNRYYFNSKLHDYLSNANTIKNKLAIIRINLDRFRYYNELLNQQGGDDLLKEVANRLRRVSADAIVVARLNADDFAVLLEVEKSSLEVAEYCKSLINAFDDTFRIKQQEFVMTVSIGVAIFPDHGRQMDSLNTHAEIALLEAKRIGGNVVRIYHHDKQSTSEPRLALENELRKAIQNDELILYYQPKINSVSKAIYGFEALIRWNHPEKGIMSPAHFIPLAEETTLISDIGKQVLEMACAQIKRWADLGFTNLTIAVNVVVQQIYRGHLIEDIDYMIKKYGINPEQLELEITETSLMENNENVRKVMDELHHRKIKIALDDFGIGYSSLSYLADYSFDVIKIDRSFIIGIGNANKEAIIRAIIAMAKAMNKIVVAEGIENQDQYDFLLKEGCAYIQGYLLGKPMPADMATAMLKEQPYPHFENLSIPK